MTQTNNVRLGVALMIAAVMIFAVQDGFSRYLAEKYNVIMIVMIRYWFFAAFVIALAKRQVGGVRAAAQTSQPILQGARGLLLAAEICVSVVAYVLLGLVETHAVFACYPLLVAALSGPVLGEHVGWRRWVAIGVGFIGVLIILRPGYGVFDPKALVSFLAAGMFALYALLTRFAARNDSTATSFFWTGVSGAIAMTLVGVWFWQPLDPTDWIFMLALCISGVAGHWLMIRCYEVAEVSAVQPFAYLHLIFIAGIGVLIFGETISLNVMLGAGVIVLAGLFTFWRESLHR